MPPLPRPRNEHQADRSASKAWASGALFHFQQNNPIWPDAQPWENYMFAIVAVVIVVANRKAMLSREGAVTEVLMPGEEGSPDRARTNLQ